VVFNQVEGMGSIDLIVRLPSIDEVLAGCGGAAFMASGRRTSTALQTTILGVIARAAMIQCCPAEFRFW
jgi:hypothetical protein